MNKVFDWLAAAGIILFGLAIALLVGTYIFWWFGGVVAGFGFLTGLGKVLSFIVALALLIFATGFGGTVCLVIGIIGAIKVFGWPWYGAVAFFLPTLALYFLGVLGIVLAAVVGLVDDKFSKIRRR